MLQIVCRYWYMHLIERPAKENDNNIRIFLLRFKLQKGPFITVRRMRIFVSCPSVYNVYPSPSFPHSRMLTITNSARFSRLSPAKTDFERTKSRGGFSRRVTNLMTTICTAIYLGIGRRMRRGEILRGRKENGFGAINLRGSRLANFAGRSKVCRWKNSKLLPDIADGYPRNSRPLTWWSMEEKKTATLSHPPFFS